MLQNDGRGNAGIHLARQTEKINNESVFNKKALLFIAYVMLSICCGSLETLGGSLYNQLESQLNTSSQTISYMLSLKPIVSGIAALVTAWVLDHIINSHYYICAVSIVTSITISLMNQMTELWQMYAAFVVIGYAIGTIFVTYPVYTLRLYPNSNRALFGLMVIYGVSKTGTPILIESSIQIFDGDYAPVLYAVSVFFVTLSIFLCCTKTPQPPSTRNGSIHQSTISSPSRLKNLKYTLYAILIILQFSYSAFQSGIVNFIQKFVTKDLHRSEKIARYLISSYYFGQTFYRLVVTIFFKNMNPMNSVVLAHVFLVFFGLLFVSFGNISFVKDRYIWILYVVYVDFGIWASAIYPGNVKICESIGPYTGLIAGLIIISFSLGDASAVFLIGHLIEIFGEMIIPFPIFVFILISFMLAMSAFCVYQKCNKLQVILRNEHNKSFERLLENQMEPGASLVGASLPVQD